MQIQKILEEVEKIGRQYQAREVILFGSRAKETAHPRSDIDLAVSGVQDFDLLLEEIENIPTLYSVDLINLDSCQNPLLLEDIKRYGRKIYPEI